MHGSHMTFHKTVCFPFVRSIASSLLFFHHRYPCGGIFAPNIVSKLRQMRSGVYQAPTIEWAYCWVVETEAEIPNTF